MQLKIIFMGTPKFSLPALNILIKNKLNILSVYSQPPKRSKRGQKINPSPIEELSKKNNLNLRNPTQLDTKEEYEMFKNFLPDLVIVVAYGKLIPKKYLDLPKFGFINIHASLLPAWRGAAPIQRAIMNRDKKIGISIMKIEEELDSGPVLISKSFELDKNLTYGEAEKKLSEIGAKLLFESIQKIKKENPKFKNQIHSNATYAKKINKDETKINWNLDANIVLSHVHALSPSPGAWFEYKNERYKVLKAKLSKASGKPSLVVDGNLTIACKSNSIQILELQRQGKKKQTTKVFLLGKKIIKGTTLG